MDRPRGTRDFAPDEMAARRQAGGRIRAVFGRFGYREVQTPTFEALELFTAKSGQGIISELYDFEDKGGRHLTLRPELTAPVMRMYHADHAFDPKPIKWFYHGPCFRYDRPQAGRYREFWQFGCEQIGAGTPLAYAELIALADSLFEAVGLRKRDLAIGHVAVLRRLVDGLALADDQRSQAMRLIDKKDADALRAHVKEHGDAAGLELLQAAMEAPDVGSALDIMGDLPEADELSALFDHLARFGVSARLDLGIARGLDYYSGIVFEVHSPALGAQSQLLGGGGYDLSQLFGGQPTPTMGFGLGFDRTLVALEAEGHEPPKAAGPGVYFGALGDAQAWVTEHVTTLRKLGIDADMDLLGRRPGQVAKAADAARAHYLVIVGPRDLEAGQVAIKDLRSGQSEDVALADVDHWLLGHLGEMDLADMN